MLSTRLALPLWRPTQEASLQALLRSDSELPGWGILDWISGRVTTFQITHTGLSPDVCCRPRLPPGQVSLSSSSPQCEHSEQCTMETQEDRDFQCVLLMWHFLSFLMPTSLQEPSITADNYVRNTVSKVNIYSTTFNLTMKAPKQLIWSPKFLSGLFPTVAHCAVSSPRASSCGLWSAVSAKKASLMV